MLATFVWDCSGEKMALERSLLRKLSGESLKETSHDRGARLPHLRIYLQSLFQEDCLIRVCLGSGLWEIHKRMNRFDVICGLWI